MPFDSAEPNETSPSSDPTHAVEKTTVEEQPSTESANSNMSPTNLSNSTWWRRPAHLFWSILALASLPYLVPYFLAAWNQEHFQYIPLVLIAVMGLAYTRHQGTVALPTDRLSMSLVGVAIFIMLIAAYLHSSWLGAIAVIFLVVAFLRNLKQDDQSSLLYLAIPLLLFVRLPQARTQALIVRLQMITTDLSSVVLDVLGVPNFVEGNTISLAGKQLFVDEACSGVRSLFTLMFFSLALMVYRKRSVWLTPLMLLVGIFLAIFGNLLRVTTIALAEAWFSYDLASGWLHDLLGHGTLLLSLVLMLSADRLIEAIFHSIGQENGAENPLIRCWNFFFSDSGVARNFRTTRTADETESGTKLAALRALAIVALILATWMGVGKTYDRLTRPTFVGDGELLFKPSPSLVAEVNSPIKLVSHRTYRNSDLQADLRLGKNADIYTCSIMKQPGEIVISQPYVGWHELTVCYRSMGWNQQTRRSFEVPGSQPIILATFKKDEGSYGYLFFSAVNADGSIPTSFGDSRLERWLTPFVPTIMDDMAETSGVGQTAMIQYWTVSKQKLSQQDMLTIGKSVASVRDRVRQEMPQ